MYVYIYYMQMCAKSCKLMKVIYNAENNLKLTCITPTYT